MKKGAIIILAMIIFLAATVYSLPLTNPGHGVEQVGDGTSPHAVIREWNNDWTGYAYEYDGPAGSQNTIPAAAFLHPFIQPPNLGAFPWNSNSETTAALNPAGDWCAIQTTPLFIIITCFNAATNQTLKQIFGQNLQKNMTKIDEMEDGAGGGEITTIEVGAAGSTANTEVTTGTNSASSEIQTTLTEASTEATATSNTGDASVKTTADGIQTDVTVEADNAETDQAYLKVNTALGSSVYVDIYGKDGTSGRDVKCGIKANDIFSDTSCDVVGSLNFAVSLRSYADSIKASSTTTTTGSSGSSTDELLSDATGNSATRTTNDGTNDRTKEEHKSDGSITNTVSDAAGVVVGEYSIAATGPNVATIKLNRDSDADGNGDVNVYESIEGSAGGCGNTNDICPNSITGVELAIATEFPCIAAYAPNCEIICSMMGFVCIGSFPAGAPTGTFLIASDGGCALPCENPLLAPVANCACANTNVFPSLGGPT